MSDSIKPRQERSRKTQQDLLDALERLLVNNSIAELSVADIAAEAGLTTGAIYSRFKDKKGLVRAASARFLESIQDSDAALDKRLKRKRKDSEKVRIIISNTLKYSMAYIPLMRAAASFNDPPAFESMRQARSHTASIIADTITSSDLDSETLHKRARFVMRITTAVLRDTFMAGPGAIRFTVPAEQFIQENPKIFDQLSDELLQVAIEYLHIKN